MIALDWGSIRNLRGWGCIQEWGSIQADTVCTIPKLWVQMLFSKKTVGVAATNAPTLTTPLHLFEMVSCHLLVDGIFESVLGSFDILESVDVSSTT